MPLASFRGNLLENLTSSWIRPGFINLCTQTKVGEARTLPKKIGAIRKVRFKQRHPILESLLYKWRSGFIGTYHANTILHTALHLLHHRTLICIRRSRHHVSDNPLCCGDLINFPFPTIVEHPLISPLVTKLFNQLRQKFERRIVRVNRRCGYLSFKAFYNRRRILQSLAIWRCQSRHDGQSRIFLVFL